MKLGFRWGLLFIAFAAFQVTGLATEFKVDPVHSTALFRVKHFDVSYYNGRFNEIEGSFVFDSEAPEKSSIDLTIKAESVYTNSERRDAHIRSADFLLASQFPELRFKSTSVSKNGEGIFEVTGDLTIRGITKQITANVELVGDKEVRQGRRAGFSTSFTINRRDFNVDYGTAAVLADEVKITIDVEGIAQ